MRWLVPLFLVACTSVSEPSIEATSGVVQKQIPIAINRRLDVLFVIDRSPAMAPYVERLQANVRRLIDFLRDPSIPNIRFAVVTTDGDGRFHGTSGMTGDFLVDFVGGDGNRQRNYAGDFGDVISRMIDVGTAGPAPEPLVAARRALEQHRAFVRTDSYLAVVFVSATPAAGDPIAAYNTEQFFKSLQPDWSRMAFAAIVGGDARITSLVERFPNRNATVSIDSEDWSTAWSIVMPLFKTSLGAPCIEAPILDPERGCTAWYDFPIGGEVITPCADTPDRQCWRLVREPLYCPLDEQRLIRIENARVDFPEEVFLNLECLTR